MRIRLVQPMKRKGTENHQFVKRIPADLRERMIGMRLEVPLAGSTVPIKVGPSTNAIRFSLRTSEPEEVKARTAAAIQYLEQLFRSLRANTPVTLTHGQAVALSRDLYDAWSADPEQNAIGTVAVELAEDGELACCRFRGHQDKVFNGTGEWECEEGSSAASSSLRQ